MDKQLHPRTEAGGRPKQYRINPYRVASVSGRFYLICNVDKYDNLTHFRIDRIMDLRVLNRNAKPISRVADAEEGIDLAEYIGSHPYMYTGKARRYCIRVERTAINDVLDWVGLDVTFINVTDACTDVLVKCEPASMDFWLRRYGEHARLVPVPRKKPFPEDTKE